MPMYANHRFVLILLGVSITAVSSDAVIIQQIVLTCHNCVVGIKSVIELCGSLRQIMLKCVGYITGVQSRIAWASEFCHEVYQNTTVPEKISWKTSYVHHHRNIGPNSWLFSRSAELYTRYNFPGDNRLK